MSWAAKVLPALEQLRDDLTAAGVPSSLERSRTPVPGAFLGPASGKTLTLAGDGRLRVHVLLVAPDQGDVAALKTLSGLLERALTVVTEDEDVNTSLVFPTNNNALPAWRLVVDLDLEE